MTSSRAEVEDFSWRDLAALERLHGIPVRYSDSRFYADPGARFDLTSDYCPNLDDYKGCDAR
jgi:hypothetical protein